MNKRKKTRLRSSSQPSTQDLSKRLGSSRYISVPQFTMLFKQIIDKIGDEVMVIAPNAKIMYANHAAVKGLGYTQAYIRGRSITAFFKPRITASEWERSFFRALKRTRKPKLYKMQRVAKGGRTQTIDVTAVYMPLNGVPCVLFVARNVTGQAALQQQLEESESIYRLLNEQAGDGIFTMDLEGRIVYANRATEQITKTSFAKAKGRHFSTFVAPASLQKARDSFNKVKNGETRVQGEIEVFDITGNKVPVEFTTTPIFKDGRMVQIHAIIRDISRRREMERLIREAEKIKAVQHFMVGITQEVRHPLKGVADRLTQLIGQFKNRQFEYIGYKDFAKMLELLETMQQQLKYCYDTTSRLLIVNKRKLGIANNFCDVHGVVKDVVHFLRYDIETSGAVVSCQFRKNLPHAAIDALEMNQIMTNVITNAVQSLTPGGKITLRTQYRKFDKRIIIECTDNGIGIPREDITRVFEPFFTTKHRGLEKSSGLGLAIVYSIIKAWKGEITIHSSLRSGTTVRMIFPEYSHRPRERKR